MGRVHTRLKERFQHDGPLVEQAMLEYGHLETKAEFLAKALQDSHGITKEQAQRIVEI